MELSICTGMGFLSLMAVVEACCGYSIVYFHVCDRPDAVIAIEQGGLSFAKKANISSACALLAASGISDAEMRTALIRQGCEPAAGSIASSFAMNADAVRDAVLESNWYAELADFAEQIAEANID